MGVPKGRRTKSKQGHRRSHHGLEKKNPSTCQNCGEPVMSHQVCKNCGQYKSRQVIDVFEGMSKKQRKEKQDSLAGE